MTHPHICHLGRSTSIKSHSMREHVSKYLALRITDTNTKVRIYGEQWTTVSKRVHMSKLVVRHHDGDGWPGP